MTQALEYLAANERRFIDDLVEYLRFPSVSAQPRHAADVRACAGWLAERCRGLGLDTVVHETPGNPVVVARTSPRVPSLPTFLVYGHYDVQPPEPFGLWTSPPFEPRVADGAIYARGACDNKGQHLAHLNAYEACIRTGAPPPCNLVFLVEGEEEVGSVNLQAFLAAHRPELKCDAVVVSDNGIPSLEHPALTCGLRGICAAEIRIDGPSRDLHSGLFGGSLENPAMALCRLLADVRDARGRIRIPGFYDDVAPMSAYERRMMARLPFDARRYARLLGVRALFGEAGFTPAEQRACRPTFEINGLTSGYQGEGSKTIVPAWATAKVTMRLVPDQKPAKILAALKAHLRAKCPDTVRLTVTPGHGGEPYLMPPDGPLARAALRAMSAGFGRPATVMREGGSIPIVSSFKRHLRADTLLLGMSLPDDNAHSPDEKFSLAAYAAGMRMAVHLWPELAAAAP